MKTSNHHRSLWAWALLAVPIPGALRCAGEEADGNASVEGLETVAQFEAARLATYCEQMARCCNTDESALSAEDCRQQLGQYSGTLERPTLMYDAQAARRCVDAYAELLSSSCEAVGADAVASACRDVVVGSVARGQYCSDDLDCAPVGNEPSRCYREYDTPVPPYCGPDASHAIRQHLSEGDACAGHCMRVPRGDSCPGAADEPMCFMRDGLQCKNGACAPLDSDGSACTVSWLCSSGHCFFPNPGTGVGVCRTPVALDACRGDEDCPPEHFCRRQPNSVEDGVLVEGAVRCEPRFATDTACTEDRECVSNNCSAGIPHPAVDFNPDGVCRAEPWIPTCATFVVYPFIP